MKKTIADLVFEFLKGKKKFTSGGTIEEWVHNRSVSKGSTIGRILRDMEESGVLSKTYQSINGARPFVCYKIK